MGSMAIHKPHYKLGAFAGTCWGRSAWNESARLTPVSRYVRAFSRPDRHPDL